MRISNLITLLGARLLGAPRSLFKDNNPDRNRGSTNSTVHDWIYRLAKYVRDDPFKLKTRV
jgi:hypothetical protein